MPSPTLTALVGTTAHAVREGEPTALCGTAVSTTTELPFPGGGSSVCRDCSPCGDHVDRPA